MFFYRKNNFSFQQSAKDFRWCCFIALLIHRQLDVSQCRTLAFSLLQLSLYSCHQELDFLVIEFSQYSYSICMFWLLCDVVFLKLIILSYMFHRDLGNSNLSGQLVPELAKLEHLRYLWVLCKCSILLGLHFSFFMASHTKGILIVKLAFHLPHIMSVSHMLNRPFIVQGALQE